MVGSRGDDVEQIQFWLNAVAEFVDTIPTVTVDGIFGQATDRAVRAFQQHFGLTVDGIVGQATWNSIYNEYSSIQTDIAPPNVDTPGQFPGTTLAVGSRGNDVKQMQFYLRIISNSNSAIPASRRTASSAPPPSVLCALSSNSTGLPWTVWWAS